MSNSFQTSPLAGECLLKARRFFRSVGLSENTCTLSTNQKVLIRSHHSPLPSGGRQYVAQFWEPLAAIPMDFDEYDYLEKMVEDSEPPKSDQRSNGGEETGKNEDKERSRSSRHRSEKNNDNDRRSKRAKSGEESRDREKERGSSHHRSSPKDVDRSDRDKQRGTRETRDRDRDKDRNREDRNGRGRDRDRERDRDKDRVRVKREHEKEREDRDQEKEKERSHRSGSRSERHGNERDREKSRDKEVKEKEREVKEPDRDRESRNAVVGVVDRGFALQLDINNSHFIFCRILILYCHVLYYNYYYISGLISHSHQYLFNERSYNVQVD
ncbi:hypothetical protein L2E82_10991 [Cichorium intybus]|uniref:Uncharacterized protein n=1 Tax=Cichorium intybus TaxID=13427 RepID=A0ACB9GD77_CICIN|nr:hypothetical protein L2E82_10991 [Cichorium intybus]